VQQLQLQPLSCFIAQIFAIIFVSRVLGWLAKKIGQPMVIAEITAGILLGPSALGVVAPELSAALFSEDSLSLMQIVSHLGLVLFMFLIGLELDPKLLRRAGHAPLVVAQATFLAPLGLGVLLALYLYPNWAKPGVPQATFAMFVGATLSSTAFPVLARILSERRLVRSRVGTLSIACAAIDDITAWCLLAFVVASTRARGLAGATATSLLALLYVAAMLAVVQPLLQRMAARFERGALSQNRLAAALLLLFLSSGATELIGIHALFGAFLAGAIIPRSGGLASAIGDRLGDTVVVVLMPLFFAYSGVRTEIGLLDSWAAWGTCGLVVAVACVGKLGAGAVAARFAAGLSWREATALGALMNTRGLMVLVVLNVGLDLGVIEPAFFSMMVVAAVITTLVATPIVDAVYPIEQHVRDLLATKRNAALQLPPRSGRICVLMCASEPSSVEALTALAQAFSPDPQAVNLHALAIRSPQVAPDPRAPANDSTTDGGAPAIKRMSFPSSDPAREICGIAEVKRADWVLLHRKDVSACDRLLGATTGHVANACECGVAILFGVLERTPRTILVLQTGSPGDGAAQEFAESLHAAEIRKETGPQGWAGMDFDLTVAGLPDEAHGRSVLDTLRRRDHPQGALVLVRGTKTSTPRRSV